MRIVSALALFAFLGGCTTVVGKLSDEDLAKVVQVGSERAIGYGVKILLDKNPDKAADIVKAAKTASEVIKANVIPAFSGASSQEVLKSAVDTALQQLSDKVSPLVLSSIQLAVNLAATQIQLPSNPADKLDARAKGAVLALYTGISAGLDKAVAASAVASRDIGPAKLVWPKD